MTDAASAGRFQVRVPERHGPGVYANGVGVWTSRHEFTIDFIVSLPPEVEPGADGQPVVLSVQEVVARVKIPPPLVFELMKNLASQMEGYEQVHGKIPDFTGEAPAGEVPGEDGG